MRAWRTVSEWQFEKLISAPSRFLNLADGETPHLSDKSCIHRLKIACKRFVGFGVGKRVPQSDLKRS